LDVESVLRRWTRIANDTWYYIAARNVAAFVVGSSLQWAGIAMVTNAGPDPRTVTRILADFAPGDVLHARELLPHVYNELRRLAAVQLADERPNHTLRPTALVNEAFLRMASGPAAVASRGHFLRLASKVMRQILVDHARAKAAARRGGDAVRYALSADALASTADPIDLLALEEALERLAALSPAKARLVELRFFGGLAIEEAADALEISRTQASREWRMARAWLADELDAGQRA
jgi:RNA polymerase sigma-70 factor (ECF subfamily)